MENTIPEIAPEPAVNTPTPKKKAPFPKIKVSNRTLVLVFVAAAILGSAYGYRHLLIAATIDGQPISRLAVIRQLEKEGGLSTLDTLITEKLIATEAAKAKIVISPADIDAELSKIKDQVAAQGLTLEQALEQQHLSLDDVRAQLATRKQLERLIGDKLTVTDQDIDSYLTETKLTPPKDMSETDFRSRVSAQLASQKFGTEAERWVTAARQKATIKYLIDYGQTPETEAAATNAEVTPAP
jgi:hypothetical protein